MHKAQETEDEEALTDIEEEHTTQLPIPEELQTPRRQPASSSQAVASQYLTPDSRSVKRKSTRLLDMQTPEPEHRETTPSVPVQRPQAKGKKTSPFDSWQRTKPGMAAGSGHGKKRAAAPEEEEAVGKRTRSGAH